MAACLSVSNEMVITTFLSGWMGLRSDRQTGTQENLTIRVMVSHASRCNKAVGGMISVAEISHRSAKPVVKTVPLVKMVFTRSVVRLHIWGERDIVPECLNRLICMLVVVGIMATKQVHVWT